MSISLRLRLPFAPRYLLWVLLRNVELILPETIYSSAHLEKEVFKNNKNFRAIKSIQP